MTPLLAFLHFFSASPTAAALPVQGVQAAAAYSAAHGGHALLVKQNGKILHESYTNGHTKYEPHRIYSGTKAFWGLTAFAAEKEGLFEWNELVADTITEWQGDPRKNRINVRQLLDFSHGLEPMFSLHENTFSDRTAAALKAGAVATPGKSFIYGPAALQVFHELLARKLQRKQTPTRYLERKVLGPLGLGSQRYLPDQRGAPLLAAGSALLGGEPRGAALFAVRGMLIPVQAAWLDIAGSALLVSTSLMLLSWAYARVEAQWLLPLEYTAFGWSALIGWWWFAEAVSGWTLAGLVLILAGVWLGTRQSNGVAAAQQVPPG